LESLQYSPGFSALLVVQNGSPGLTAYRAGRLILIGRKPDGSALARERLIEDGKGLRSDGRTLCTGGRRTPWRCKNGLRDGGRTSGGADRLFLRAKVG
jgi:hypothetical protein